MALNHRQLRFIDRDMVAGWLANWRALPQPRPKVRDYIAQQLETVQAGLSGETLDTSARDDYADDEVPILQIIMDDIRSYA